MATETPASMQGGIALRFIAEKGTAAQVCFDGNPKAAISRRTVVKCGEALSSAHAEEFIALLVNPAFKAEAAKQGKTLVECIHGALQLIPKNQAGAKAVETPQRLAALLAQLAPNETPEQLADRLRKLVAEQLDGAVKFLNECVAKNGRDKDGHILLRFSKKGVQ